MFGKSFKLVFGIGAGVVATLSLAAVAIGLGAWAFQLIDSPRQKAEARLYEFTKLCSNLPDESWKEYASFMEKYGEVPPPPAGSDTDPKAPFVLELRKRIAINNAQYRRSGEELRAVCAS